MPSQEKKPKRPPADAGCVVGAALDLGADPGSRASEGWPQVARGFRVLRPGRASSRTEWQRPLLIG